MENKFIFAYNIGSNLNSPLPPWYDVRPPSHLQKYDLARHPKKVVTPAIYRLSISKFIRDGRARFNMGTRGVVLKKPSLAPLCLKRIFK